MKSRIEIAESRVERTKQRIKASKGKATLLIGLNRALDRQENRVQRLKDGPKKRTTGRAKNIAEMSAKDAKAYAKSIEDYDVLMLVKKVEENRDKPRASVLAAIEKEEDLFESQDEADSDEE